MMRLRVEETGRVQVCAISWGKIRYKRKDDSSASLLSGWRDVFFLLAILRTKMLMNAAESEMNYC